MRSSERAGLSIHLDERVLLHCRPKWNCLPVISNQRANRARPRPRKPAVVHQSAGVVLQMTRGRRPERVGSQAAQLSTKRRGVEMSKRPAGLDDWSFLP